MEKFKFDRVFSFDGEASEPKPRPRRTFRADEVETVKAESYTAGERSGVVKAEQSAAASASVIAAGVQELINTMRAELDTVRDDSTRLAALIARKFVAHMIDKAPELYLERCIDECLEVVHREPEVVITIPANSSPSLKQRLALIAQKNGLGAGLRIEEDASIKGVACRLNWRSGGAEITLEDALTRMDQIIEDHIASLAAARSDGESALGKRLA